MADLANIVSEQIHNPRDAEAALQALILVLLVAAVIAGGVIFAVVIRSVEKETAKDKTPDNGNAPPEESP
jgi:hypothetical protein